MTQRGHTVVATILVLTGMLLMRLGSVEIQPWDEGLYAVRGESIVRFDAWMDQTPHAIGGLYSSTPPPLVPWAVALSIRTIGPTTVAVRLFSVLCAALAMSMLYLIARRIVTFEHAIVGVIALAGSLAWSTYARQAMTEVPLMAFTLTAMWAAIRLGEGWRQGALVFGVAFGAALLTKMVVSFVPLLFLVPFIVEHRRNATRLALAGGAVALGVVIALPWYWHMASTYGNDFLLALTVPHVGTAVEGNAGRIGPLYYVNQLMVSQALAVVAFLYVTVAAIRRTSLPERRHVAAILALAWFVLGMLAFSISATKNPHYVVMLVPPMVLTAVYGMERMLLSARRRMLVGAYGLVAAATVWSLAPAVRASMRTAIVDPVGQAVLGLMLLCMVLPWVLPRRVIDTVAVTGFRVVLYGVVAVMMVRAGYVMLRGQESDIRGGRDVAEVLLDGSARSFDYIFHRHNAGDAFNPQLDWYLAGWMTGWMPTKSYTPVALPVEGDASLDDVMRTAAMLRASYVVYYHPGDTRFVSAVTEALDASYSVVLLDRDAHYTLYRRRASRHAP